MILDFHTHIGVDEINGWRQSPSELLRSMDENDISKAVVFGFPGEAWPTEANRMVLDAYAARPTRFVPFAIVNPTLLYRTQQKSPRLHLSRLREEGFRGIVINPTLYNLRLVSSKTHEIVEWCGNNDMPIIVHYEAQWVDELSPFVDLAREFSNTTFIVPAPQWIAGALKMVEDLENVFVDTSKGYGRITLHQLAESVGIERIVYGSEIPMMHPKLELAKLRTAGFDAEEQEMIKYYNGASILSIDEGGFLSQQ